MKKNILGLDLGTNSIGWALIENDSENEKGKILGMGSRIIPMSQEILGEFGKGNSVSQTADRTKYRSIRRLRERNLLRRERLHRVLNVLDFLPEHYANDIDFEKRFGKFKDDTETKLVWKKNGKKENGKDKFEFAFQTTYYEMLDEFKKSQPTLTNKKNEDVKVPYDWTIYYLRKKALSQKITKEELAWLILNFNQKRGYYQLRGEEEEETSNKLIEFHSLKIVDVIADESHGKNGELWYSLILENGWVYRRSSKTSMFDWKDKTRNFIVTTDLNDDGSIKIDKEGNEKRSFRAPSDNDWTLIKKKTEQELDRSNKTVGIFIYETLLKNPNQKIRGQLIRTIERKYYKEELKEILEMQIKLQPHLFSDELYNACIRELYKNNEEHQFQLSKRDFVHLFLNDIIFYHRPLRSQKSSIGNCTLEYNTYKINGKEKQIYSKAIPKSNPYYQEFRIWQWMYNLSIYKKEDDKNVTKDFLRNSEDIEKLFDFLNNRKEIEQKPLLKYFLEKKGLKSKELSNEIEKYRWNYVEDKKYPCNETATLIRMRLGKIPNVLDNFLTRDIEFKLWHIIYSVTDKIEYEKALRKFALKHTIHSEAFVEAFKKFPPFKSDYGSYSEKAIKKLLPLLRTGKYWKWDNIDKKTQTRIDRILSGEFDKEIQNRVREKAISLTEQNHFQGLQLWLASYVVYDRHSEASNISKWNTIEDLKIFLNEFKQHSLRNPIVEQVLTETLRVVKDIWDKYGNGTKDFIDEIHIELGRDMKNNADDRKRMTNQISENENTNLRIKSLIMELKENSDGKLVVKDVRPYSPIQQEALKIYEDGVLNSNIEVPDDIVKISKMSQPTKAELARYKLWLEQKYCSPYTGKAIPLSKLFTTAYEIEHVIPQSRYFDDSFSNKVICESEVNKLKDNQLGLEFVKNHHGQKISTNSGEVEIFSEDAYTSFVKKHYEKNRSKKSKLLLEEIPDKMIERQMNDTRYISKYISSILSNIVREEKDDDGINSKNIVPGNGKITSQLKQDWGLNDVWNELILSRFERMNELTKTDSFTSKNTNNKIIPTVPLELSKGFQKKRIDHRHHAMDALIIACATRSHLNYLNNISAKVEDLKNEERKKKQIEGRNQLKNKLCIKTKPDENGNYKWLLKKPWETFTQDAQNELEKIVVSFKQNLRVINKATNTYEKFENGKKSEVKQEGLNWAIRKSMHKDTVSGKIHLPRIKVPNGKILTATRKSIDTSFTVKTIDSITDTGIQKILKNYLVSKGNNYELAFSPEGIEDLNKNISIYNDGKPHQPILKVRIFELGSKFQLGQKGNKKDKYVEAAKGTNLFFAIYQDQTGKRLFETIPLNEVIERQKQGLSSVPETNQKGNALLFHLSPNDLVYVPTEEESSNLSKINLSNPSKEHINRIYKMVSSSSTQCFFVKHEVATTIVNKLEFSTLNKMEKSIDEIMIKDTCIKLKIDRLGNISKA
jgi:CRISPR-associated endonuclease Csn1